MGRALGVGHKERAHAREGIRGKHAERDPGEHAERTDIEN